MFGLSFAGARARACLVVALLLPSLADAALNPPSGTVSDAAPTLTYMGGPIAVSDPQALCPSQQFCEDFPLTTAIPQAYLTAHPNAKLEVTMTFTPGVDMALKVLKGAVELGASDNGVGQPEVITLSPLAGTQADYKIRAYVFAGAVSSYTVTVKLLSNDITPSAPPTHTPRFAPYLSPAAMGNGAGEPSVGFNRTTKRIMFQSGLETLKVTFPELRTDALNPGGLPEACDALWEDKSFVTTSLTTLDPIMTGTIATTVAGTFPTRIYSGQLGPKSHLMAFTDDDGENWTPSEGNVPGISGVDHQTIGLSPYAPSPVVRPLTAYPYALYYCGQDIAYANCARSDDGGITFGAAIPTYNTTQCGGLHGHIRGGPDGTVYLPNKGCGPNQGVAYSRDNGINWTVSVVPDSSAGSNDPQVSVAADNTGYFCYGNGDGRPRAARFNKNTAGAIVWQPSADLSGPFDIKKVVFPQGVAGDPNRASCAFLGTTTDGNSEALDFAGIWHVYIATTYDAGANWVTVRASGNDPVQGAGGICTSGTTCGANRNLLDFNDMTIDHQGRPIFGFADGCVGGCVNNPNSVARTDKASMIRMVSDKTLFAQFDRAEPYVAKASCLAGSRTTDSSLLNWKAPADDGAAAIVKYKVYRGTTPDALALVGETPDAKPLFEDLTAGTPPSQYYRVTAINAAGEGVQSNLIKLDIGAGVPLQNICLPPGADLLEDQAGDIFMPTGQTSAAQLDVRKLSVSQPYFDDGSYKIYLHLKMQSLAAPLPAATWPVNFCSPAFACVNPDTNTAPYSATNKYYTVRMTTDPSVATGASPNAPVFQVLQPTAMGATAASRTVVTLPGGAAGSGFTAAGLITFVVNATQIGLSPAGAGTQKIGKFQVRINAGAVTPDNMPDSLVGSGEYNTATLSFCAPNAAPVPDLMASTQKGNAPLVVTFGYSGTDPDAIDNVAEFRLDFGDGSPVQTFTSAGSVSHTYDTADNYVARLTVKDSRGLVSATPATKVIEVLEAVQEAVAPFTFLERTNVKLNTFITSELITLGGFTGTLPISVSSGLQYSLNGGPFTNAVGTVSPGDKLAVRHISANAENTARESMLTVGSGDTAYSTVFRTVTTTLDRVPDAFDFGTVQNQAPGTLVESAVRTLKGYDTASIVAGPGLSYSLNGAPFTSNRGTLDCGNADKTQCTATLKVRHTTNTASLGYTKSTLTVGGVKGTFITRTRK